MKLSVLVPVYNVEKYIARCLDSVYAQIETEDEIILVDDGSTDNSGTICDKYKERYPLQTFVYHKENQGAYPTRNFALDRCSGDYVWLIDPDDYIQDGAIKAIKNYIKVNDVEVLSLAYKRFTDYEFYSIENSFEKIDVINGKNYLINYIPNPYLWSHIYRRKFLTDNNIRFSDHLNTQGDWLFNMIVNINAEKIHLSSIYAYNYYVSNPTSTLMNPSISHRIKCVNNSLTAIDEFQSIIAKVDNHELIGPLMDYQSFTLAGFVYSLFSLNMTMSYVRHNLLILKSKGLYPIQLCSYNKKARMFLRFANKYHIFLFVCKLRNVLKKEMKIDIK